MKNQERIHTEYTINSTNRIMDAITPLQLELCRQRTQVGDVVSFTVKDAQTGKSTEIEGVVASKYTHIFMLEDGRGFTWIDYLLGDQWLKHELKKQANRMGELEYYKRNRTDREEDRNYTSYRYCLGENYKKKAPRTQVLNSAKEMMRRFNSNELARLKEVINT